MLPEIAGSTVAKLPVFTRSSYQPPTVLGALLIDCPVILFQGMDDKVVPPNQAELMAAALRAKGLPVALLTFEGEGHGFRRGETIKASIEAQIYFLSQIFDFEPADRVSSIPIDNLAT